jgi:hypothetical protein
LLENEVRGVFTLAPLTRGAKNHWNEKRPFGFALHR